MADITQTTKWLIRGEKVRRSHWCKTFWLKQNNGVICQWGRINHPFPFKTSSLFAKDWETYEEVNEDMEYLDNKFPKGDKRRGEAMVLLALARKEGKNNKYSI